MLVADINSIATIPPMKKPKKSIESWQQEDAARLKELFSKRAGKSQSDFGAEYDIGSQGMVWQYLNAHRPLNIAAAQGFARGLEVDIDEFSPTIAAQIRQASSAVTNDTLRVVRAQTRDSAENLPLAFDLESGKHPHNSDQSAASKTKNVPPDVEYLDEELRFRPIPVIGRAQGGMPERIWTDGDYAVGATDKYAMVATSDQHAFLTPIVGTSMVPKFNPGDYAFVEPETPVEIEDDVLVRLATGETMLKRLISRRGGVQLASYNEPGTMLFAPEEITWMYYVAHYIPARKIKNRITGE